MASGPIHTGREVQAYLLANRNCSCEWECSHWTQVTSTELPTNLRARVQWGLGLRQKDPPPPGSVSHGQKTFGSVLQPLFVRHGGRWCCQGSECGQGLTSDWVGVENISNVSESTPSVVACRKLQLYIIFCSADLSNFPLIYTEKFEIPNRWELSKAADLCGNQVFHCGQKRGCLGQKVPE